MVGKGQEIPLANHFGCARFAYNHFLSDRMTQHKVDKKFDSCKAQGLALTQVKCLNKI